jgi:hypothetical protein
MEGEVTIRVVKPLENISNKKRFGRKPKAVELHNQEKLLKPR